MKTSNVPFRWPFPAPPRQRSPARQGGVTKPRNGLTRGGMVADVVLVIFWGASIPGLMWLGAVGGF